MSFSLEGKVVMVTGAAGGIGGETALQLLDAGARVVACDRNTDGLDSRLDTEEVLAVKVDVTDFEALEVVVARAERELGPITAVVANAAVLEETSIVSGDPQLWRRVVDTNVLGTALTLRAALPSMVASGGGHVVLMSSISGRTSYAGQPLYIATKWAIIGLGHAIRRELSSSRIRVTIVEPGLVDTPFARSTPHGEQALERFRGLDPADVARSVLDALDRPPHVNVTEISIQPVDQDL